jgi:S1-C subfamily serine protease
LSTITELQEAIASAAERVGPAVVGLGRGWGRGSGVVVAPGRVLTNAHNLRGNAVTVNFGDGRRETGTVAGTDPDFDLAAIQVDTGDVQPVEWQPEEVGAVIGTAVVALANRGGRGLRATLGFVSSAGRDIRGPRGRTIAGCIEHTAPLPRGSGGGPLVDVEGRLLGLNAIRLEAGLIVAVPAGEELAARAERLWSGEAARPVRLGVALAPPRVARRMRRAVGLPEREGVLVRSVAEDSPAAAAGIEPGDLIVSVGGRALERLDVLYEALDSASPGDRLELRVLRGADERDVTVELNVEPQEVTT